MGTVSGSGTYLAGSGVTARAAPKGGYVFVNWTESGSPVSTSSNFTFTLTGPRTLQAHFTAGWSIQATSSSPAGGTVTGAGGYPAGSNVTLVAQPSAGYRFTGWTEGGSLVGGSPTYSFAATTNRVIVGNFALIIPSLRMASAGAGDLWIEWPAALPGWVLQESPDLAPASWSNSTRAVSVSGTNHHVTVVPSGPRAFFRIIHP
jgi:uncharacterized repeat protein (TIGR02543 family)